MSPRRGDSAEMFVPQEQSGFNEAAPAAPRRPYRLARRPEERVRVLGGTVDLVRPEEVFHFVTGKLEAGQSAIVANHNPRCGAQTPRVRIHKHKRRTGAAYCRRPGRRQRYSALESAGTPWALIVGHVSCAPAGPRHHGHCGMAASHQPRAGRPKHSRGFLRSRIVVDCRSGDFEWSALPGIPRPGDATAPCSKRQFDVWGWARGP